MFCTFRPRLGEPDGNNFSRAVRPGQLFETTHGQAASRLRSQPVQDQRGAHNGAGQGRSGEVEGELPAGLRLALRKIMMAEDIRATVVGEALTACVELPPPLRDVVLGSLMTAVMLRGPVAEELFALIDAALTVDQRPPAETITGYDRPVILLAGSGKKGQRTLNVSTLAGLVAAAAGAVIVKVGSAATSSALGSRDLVRALGVQECRTACEVRTDLAASRFAFVAVEPQIPIVDEMYRGRFHVVNPFSFGLAPLASPVRADLVVYGLAHPRVDLAARVLARFGVSEAVVHTTRTPGGAYLDELGAGGDVASCDVLASRIGAVEYRAAASLVDGSLGMDLPPAAEASQAAELASELLAGAGLSSHRTLVSLNAGHLLSLSGIALSLTAGMRLAEDVLRSGTPAELILRQAAVPAGTA